MDQHIVGGPLNIVPSRDTRTDLLAWLNDLLPQATASGYEVPRLRKVEHCGNGVPYVLLLPQMLPYVHPQLLSRAKVPAKHDFEAVSNLKLMAEALHKNGIPPPEVLVDDVDKLIKGGFQANLQLLQWFRGLGEALTPQQCPDEYHKEPKPQHQHVNALDSPSPSSDRNAHIVQRGVPKEGSDSSRMATHSRMEAADAKRQLRTVSAGCSAGVGPAAVADTPSALSATNSTTVSRGEAVVNTKNSSSSRRTSIPWDGAGLLPLPGLENC
uniref:Calponin-homology (CH) domain-containing protein n=1 Tax=Trypanosoma congolense (strain IL3000) TaxID=1068625 RepID=G0UTH3_TRYCI|nr:conserved hypothetical protein [Trypanosoma congolense IL3000]